MCKDTSLLISSFCRDSDSRDAMLQDFSFADILFCQNVTEHAQSEGITTL